MPIPTARTAATSRNGRVGKGLLAPRAAALRPVASQAVHLEPFLLAAVLVLLRLVDPKLVLREPRLANLSTWGDETVRRAKRAQGSAGGRAHRATNVEALMKVKVLQAAGAEVAGAAANLAHTLTLGDVTPAASHFVRPVPRVSL